jgi:hypothetical protein
MLRNLAFLVALLLPALPGCSKAPPPGLSGTAAIRMKDPVWATFGWSRGQMVYVIYFVPSSAGAFNGDGAAANITISKEPKEPDMFEGGLDGNLEKSKSPFKANGRTYEVSYEGKSYRMSNGKVLLITVGPPSKVQQLQAVFGPTPKISEDIPQFMEKEVRRLAKENPKIGEFPKEPYVEKGEKTKKK